MRTSGLAPEKKEYGGESIEQRGPGLFTPSGTSGSPGRPSRLTGKRITEGEYVFTGEEFMIVDNWKDHRDAHRHLQGSWIGSTTFEVDPKHGSVRGRLPGADETDGPADEKEQDTQGRQARSKPDTGRVWVKRSAGDVA